ncbi:uncharacterized protein BDCG_16429 [Blastomyces dermatitidis ER-3]|uniref:Uncharacterized protein n=1 Tax=Ajellomyces dermatitidis (strain ER-3 / ATCC MYA-2586) TaxID=559297 RepID=A0ABX2VS28_AJEDR|nr:uncharacterized protein BDCG_16429 [Blastomyces dermatitidis ER-3]OAT00022.1 hypothetical protein BDCG_16429 [Blastomyces dermatitidis ER-3]
MCLLQSDFIPVCILLTGRIGSVSNIPGPPHCLDIRGFKAFLEFVTRGIKGQIFDKPIPDTIYFDLKYTELSKQAVTRVWMTFLNWAGTEISDEELEKLLQRSFNGWQIKNIVGVARALAGKGAVTFDHIKDTRAYLEEFDCNYTGPGGAENMNSYT